jgi:putative transposase
MGTTVAELRGGRVSIYQEIREMMRLQGKGRVERCCRLAGVSRAGFYRHWQAAEPAAEEMELRHQMQLIFVAHRGHYGYRRVTMELRHQGMLVNKKRVARLMREDNLLAISKRKFVLASTDSDHDLPVYLNLAARMVVTGMNQLWVADITYIRLSHEFVFLAVVIDVYSRRVIGRSISRSIDTQLTLAALKQAIETRQPKPGLVLHNDQGVQYASRDYVGELLAHGIIPSMSRPGNPYDNAFCESFMKTLKKEEIYCNKYQDLDDLTQHAEEFIDQYYNRQRLHSALGYRSPADFEAAAAQAAGESGEANGLGGAPKMMYFTPPGDHNLDVTD